MKRYLLGLLALVAGSYLLTPGATQLTTDAGFWAWRREAVLLSGYAGLLLMTAAIVLATRPTWLERRIGGLDKGYALHKWLGIAAGVTLGLHWFAEKGGRWLVELGWVVRGMRRHGPHDGGHSLIGFARETGEWAFYVLVALLVVALVKRIPYRYFRWVHKALALVFVAGAFHGVVLMPDAWYSGPAGFITPLAAAIGCLAAYWSLSGRIGGSRKLRGTVESVTVHAGGLVDLCVALPAPGLKYAAGQFVFLQFDPHEGAHPFTVASADDPCRPRFAIKALGDYTGTLASRLAAGQSLELEGPYGCFDFSADGTREIWIGGGIGITPFLARLDALAAAGGSARPVDFWFCAATAHDAAFPDDLEARCARAGVRLHRMVAESDGLLSAERVAQQIGTLAGSSVWFCGPQRFGATLRKGLLALGLPSRGFHAERFVMR